MRDTLSEWGQTSFVVAAIGTAIVRGWRVLWRGFIFMMRPDLYERANQALEWEREQNRILREENDRLNRRARSGDSPSGKDGASTSTE